MFGLKIASVLIVCLVVINADDAPSLGLRAVLRVYDECQKAEGGFPPCITKKTISFIDRVTKIDAINIGDGVKLVRTDDSVTDEDAAATQTDYEQSLPRGLEARDEALSLILFERISQFFNGRVLKINLPKLSSNDIGRQLEEDTSVVEARHGHKKKKFKVKKKYKKYLLPLLIAYKLKFFTLVPVIISGLMLLAGSTGMAGFFFALFTAVITLKHREHSAH